MAEHKKPTGTSGYLSLGPVRPGFQPVQLPERKDEIEAFILRAALATAEKCGLDPYGLVDSPIQNIEDDFDFTLPTKRGQEYLDLMEVAPLEGSRGYQDAPLSYKVGERVDFVWTELTKKAQKYGLPGRQEVHLLIYSTDQRFRLDSATLKLLSYHCHVASRGFQSVHAFALDDERTGELFCIWPDSGELPQRAEVRRLRNCRILVSDLPSVKIRDDGGTGIVPLGSAGPPRDTNK